MSGLTARRLSSFFAAALVLFAFTSTADAQGIVQGAVVDRDNKPVEGATVTIASDNNSRKFEVRTDRKGEFFQIGVPSGPYTVTVVKDSLKASSKTMASAGRPAVVNVTLAPAAPDPGNATAAANAAAATLQALNKEAIAASDAGDHTTAVAKYTEMATIIPTCAECYDGIGREHLVMKGYEEAEAAFKKAIELNPAYAGAYNGLANLYNAQKKFDLAAEASAKATELGGTAAAGGGSADALYNQGVIAWNAGKADEARGHFEAALTADANFAPAHFQLGMALVNGNKLAEARAAFESYLKLAPDGEFAQQAKAMLGALPK